MQNPWLHKLQGIRIKRFGLSLVLWGEAGVGKSFLAQHWISELGCRYLKVHSSQAFSSWWSQLPALSHAPRWMDLLLERVKRGTSLSPEEHLQIALSWLGALTPFILYVEDLHECEPNEAEFWKSLARQLKEIRGMGTLITSRAPAPDGLEEYHLLPLSREDIEQIVEKELGGIAPKEATEWLYTRAHGNPLFTLEYLRFLIRKGYLWNDRRSWRWRDPMVDLIPLTIEALIEAALSSPLLSEHARRAMETRSILPLFIGKSLWAAVAGLSMAELEEARLELERSGLLIGEAFAHPLYREVCSHNLSSKEQQEFKGRAWTLLQDDPQAALLFLEGSNLSTEGVAEWCEGALEKLRLERPDEVVDFLSQVVPLVQGDQRGEWALEAARQVHRIDLQRAIELAEIAVEEKHSPEATYLLAELRADQEHPAQGLELLDKMPGEWQTRPEYLRCKIGLLAKLYQSQEVVDLWFDHPNLQESHPEVGRWAAGALVDLGRFEDGEKLIQTLPDRVSPEHRADVIHTWSYIKMRLQNFADAERLMTESIEMYRKTDNRRQLASALHNRAILWTISGQIIPQRKNDLEEASRLYLEARDLRHYAICLFTLGQFLTDEGEFLQAEENLLESRDMLSSLDNPNLMVCDFALSLLYQRWQTPYSMALAVKYAQSSARMARTGQNPYELAGVFCRLAQVLAWQGQASRAWSALEEARTAYEQIKNLEDDQILQEAQGHIHFLLGEPAKALSIFQSLLDRQPGVLSANTQEYRLMVAHIQNDLSTARSVWEWAHATGLRSWAHMAERMFPKLHEMAAAQQEREGTAVRLELLGAFRVRLPGEETKPYRGGKRQALLACLLEARILGRPELGQLELIDMLYSDIPEEQAASSLKAMVHLIRGSVGNGVIQTTTTGYTLGQVTSDVEDFLAGGPFSLWRGPYLERVEFESNPSVRDALYQTLFQRLNEDLENNPMEATRVGKILLEAEPYDRDILRLVLRAFYLEDNTKVLEKTYKEARNRLAEVGDNLPATWKVFLDGELASD